MKAVRFPKKVEPLLVPIDQIHQHPDNPNNGDVDELITSIKRSGFVTVITADARTGNIIAGNHRYQALLALGATQAPVLWVDYWDRDDALTYLVGDNETGRRAVMNKKELADILLHLRDTERGLEGTGHNEETLLRLMQEVLAEQNPLDQTPGFGGDLAPSGIFQVIIEFDNARDRDEAYESIRDEYEGYDGVVRTANL